MQTSHHVFTLRVLMVLSVLIIVAEIAVGLDTKAVSAQAPDTDVSNAVGFVVIMLALSGLVSFIGLWWTKRWARLVFTLVTIALPMMDVLFLSSTAPSNRLTDAFETASSLLDGAILSLIWFAMREKFQPSRKRIEIAYAV